MIFRDFFLFKVIFTDESVFCVTLAHPRQIRTRSDSNIGLEGVGQRQAWPLKGMIWACFSSAGPGNLPVAVGTMKTENEFLKLSNGLVKMNGFPFKPMPLAIPQRLLNGLLKNKG